MTTFASLFEPREDDPVWALPKRALTGLVSSNDVSSHASPVMAMCPELDVLGVCVKHRLLLFGPSDSHGAPRGPDCIWTAATGGTASKHHPTSITQIAWRPAILPDRTVATA